MKVLFLPEVVDYFLNMADALYDKGYFGFEENAIKYARELFLEIEKELPMKLLQRILISTARECIMLFSKETKTQLGMYFLIYSGWMGMLCTLFA